MLVAIGSQELVKRGAKVYHINLLSYAKDGVHDEDAQYTRHCFKSVRGDISKLGPAQVSNLIGNAIAAVHEWWDEQNALLIIDEWAYTAAKFGQYADLLKEFVTLVSGKISTLTSSGMKRTLAIWAIAPEMRAGNMLECGGKSIKGMSLTYVTVPPGKAVEWQGQAVGFDDQLFDQVGYNFSIKYPTMADAAGQDRIAYVGDQWLPLGTSPEMLLQSITVPKQIPPSPVTPSPSASPVVDEFSVDDLILSVPAPAASTEFVDGTLIPALERAKAVAPQSEMMIDLVNWLRGRESVTLTDASQAGWSKKAKANDWIPDRTGETIATVLSQLVGDKYRLLAPEPDGKTWRVTLR
jgi:hypothetical protein